MLEGRQLNNAASLSVKALRQPILSSSWVSSHAAICRQGTAPVAKPSQHSDRMTEILALAWERRTHANSGDVFRALYKSIEASALIATAIPLMRPGRYFAFVREL